MTLKNNLIPPCSEFYHSQRLGGVVTQLNKGLRHRLLKTFPVSSIVCSPTRMHLRTRITG